MPSRYRRAFSSVSALALPALAAASLLGSCAKPAPPRQQRVPVTVARAEKRAMPYAILASGTVEPVQTANVGSQVGGVVTRIVIREGQDVHAGQALIELDARPFRTSLAQAQGQLARDRAQAVALRLEAERASTLLAQHLLSQSEYDAKRAAADAIAGSVESDSAAVSRARLDLEFATIRAPFAGRTGNLNVHVGDYVKSATAEPLVTVNQVRPIRVRFTVSESDRPAVERVRSGNPQVRVRVSPDDSLEIVGRLSFVDNAVDPATGTLVLKGEFPNADGKLWPGEFVEVRLVLSMQQDALVIPSPAVSNGQQGTYVYVLNADSTATSRPVVVLRSDDTNAVIAKGLQAGETVITDGQFRISPGARIVVRNAGAGQKPRP
jgi:membrane fusion protein, multidrug efflux system